MFTRFTRLSCEFTMNGHLRKRYNFKQFDVNRELVNHKSIATNFQENKVFIIKLYRKSVRNKRKNLPNTLL